MILRGNHCEVNFLRPCSEESSDAAQSKMSDQKATVPSDNVGSSSDCENRAKRKNPNCLIPTRWFWG